MGSDELGEHCSKAVNPRRWVSVSKQRTLSHEHRVADQSPRPQRKCGPEPGLEGNSPFQFRSQDLDHPVTVERHNDICANLDWKTLG
jgi:hypothetical protein